jgi:lia operon protein LiaG
MNTRAGLLLAMAIPTLASAQRVERFTLRGTKTAVFNVAGKVTVEPGSGSAVTVEVTRNGADARELRIEERTVDGRTALCVIYPDERIIYRDPSRRRGSWNTTTSVDGDCQSGGRRWLGGRRVEVRSSGDGVEAWADIRIQVPAGQDIKVWNAVGTIEALDVNATMLLDAAAGTVATTRTRGLLNIDTGSGGATVSGHRGNVTVDVGSGSVRVDDVDGELVSIDSGSGSLTGENISADNLSFDTGSGGVDFARISARRVSANTGSGSVRLGITSGVETLEVDTGSGSVTVGVPGSFGGRVDISTGSGGISTEFPLQVRGRDRNELHGTIGNGRGRLLIETGSGGVRLVRSTDDDRGSRRGPMR